MSLTIRFDRAAMSATLGISLAISGALSEAFGADTGLYEQNPEPSFDQNRFHNEAGSPDWSLVIGGGGMYRPEYEGSEKLQINPVPVVLFTYGEWLKIDPSGISVRAFERDGFSLSGKVGYEMGRDEDDADRLNGLGDIDLAATIGARAAYVWNGIELYAELDQTMGGSESLVATFGAEYSVPVTERLILGTGTEAIFANKNHMQAYFGVNAAQSAASGLSEYEAKAGLKRVNVKASATYLLTKNWLVRGEAGLGILTGDAADSPVVEEKLQPSASLFVGYKF
ncbi:MipA/OmpV family protein [Agrobacterium bohemicum]|uniref:MltA-interacting MipA family protein n=1 Tax=Agrobacterium bohemicum TaxID=2052828 RepID=A0A135NYD6_9HYPH|nr:MipA/OmpV family protein [Agrobacterium bohemicum]KXG84149.1 MltA-interacting MipA family protein [Agrobacterium bohemicum]